MVTAPAPAAATGDAIGAHGVRAGSVAATAEAAAGCEAIGDAGAIIMEAAGEAAGEAHAAGLLPAGMEAIGDCPRAAVAVSSTAALTRKAARGVQRPWVDRDIVLLLIVTGLVASPGAVRAQGPEQVARLRPLVRTGRP